MLLMAEEYEGWFINEETGQEINVQYSNKFVFITEYKDGHAVAKFIFDVTKRTPEYIVEFIKTYGVL